MVTRVYDGNTVVDRSPDEAAWTEFIKAIERNS